jgi:ribonuclease E
MTDESAPATQAIASEPEGANEDGAAAPGSTTGTPRRRRRGGRGRGGRGEAGGGGARTGTSTARAGTATADPEPEIDLDRQPGEVERLETATIQEADAGSPSGSGTARRRRRRGGRGRGGAARRATAGGGASGAPEAGPAGAAGSEPVADEEIPTGAEGGAPDAPSSRRKRRRRGGRGRGRTSASAAAATESATETAEAAPKPKATRTRSRSGTGSTKAVATRPREARPAKEQAPAAEAPASTRLKRQRQSRQVRRRRDVTPAVERVTDKLMVITEHGDRDQIAVLEGRDLVQHYVTRQGAHSMVGNVYLGRVQNVLPGMEAAFVDVGRGRNAVLYAGEVNWSPEDLEGAPPRIEHVLKSGQSVLVQVTKDPIGGKGARLTAQISLPGRYLVLAPDSNVTGISRRLPDGERRRLKTIYKKLKPDPHGLIVRTAAEGASEEELASDLNRLLEEWSAIEKRAKKAKAPAVLYEEPELTVRVVRDLFTDEEYRDLVTDSPRIYRLIADYLREIAPDLLAKVRLHEGKLSAFEEFHIVEQIHKALDRKVWLPSGGYIVIERTEALTVIDVNTGKSVGKTNLEETVVNTNVEASREVARQLRLRDIGGMIVIDFIDMLLEQNKKKVIDAMKEALAQDKSRSQVFDISPLGLLEVTRKRVSGGLLDAFSETCPTCEGRGLLLTYDVN